MEALYAENYNNSAIVTTCCEVVGQYNSAGIACKLSAVRAECSKRAL